MASKDSLRSFSRGSETISVFTCELVDDQVCALKPVLKVPEGDKFCSICWARD